MRLTVFAFIFISLQFASRQRSEQEEYQPAEIVRRGKKKGYAVRGYDICLIGEYNMIGGCFGLLIRKTHTENQLR